jgi:hypothetical protein
VETYEQKCITKFRKHEGMKPRERPRRRWENNIKTDRKEIVCMSAGLIGVRVGLVARSCEHDEEALGYDRAGNFLTG